MDDVILRTEHISKSFPGVKALEDISITIKKGEVHVIVGENGAGKSTLMKIMAGVYQKDEGTIYFEGSPIELESIHKAQNQGISIIHQELNLLPYRTVGQNIFLGREIYKNKALKIIDEEEMYRRSKEVLQSLNMDVDPRAMVWTLGIAQQQMVEVAKALSFKSKVLIMDEPTATLTKREISKLFDTIRKLKNDGVSIIYISHRLEEIVQIADMLSIMRDGKLVKTVPANQITIDEMIKLMVGREITNQYPRDYNTPGEEVLRVENIASLRFKDVSFNLHRGEIVGFSGLVGAGRTEVARTVFGCDRMEAGNIYVFGKPVKKMTPGLAKELGIGLIPENRKEEGLVLEMPIKSNIVQASLGKIFKSKLLDKKKEKEVADRYAKELRIATTDTDKIVKYLSGGNQQKVVIAKWLCTDCDILIFDEPTRGIDVGAKSEIYAIMNELVKKGKAIVIISSDIPELLGMCDRTYVMKDGKISAHLPKEEATQETLLSFSI